MDHGHQAATTQYATTRSATTQSLPPGPPLLHTPQGDYFGGNDFLIFASTTGDITTWPLPPAATGNLKPWLIRTPDNLLFLYNQPGRILRIRPTLNKAESFKLEATFTKRIPNIDHPDRIWLDPDGRIIIADKTQLSILFPNGRIPRSTLNLIPANELDEEH